MSNTSKENKGADLIVYCENGILAPIREITTTFEKSSGLRVQIKNDCARNLTSQIYYHREADIYIPDSRQSIDNILKSNPHFITDSVFLGYQTLVFMVKAGNPKDFNGDLQYLHNPVNSIILANPESSTLGLATSLLLKHHSIYDPVMKSVLFFTTDSRGLIHNIAANQASVAINWKSEYYSNKGEMPVDTITIPSTLKYHPAMAVVLKDGLHPANSKKYIKMLISEKGQQIFSKYSIESMKGN